MEQLKKITKVLVFLFISGLTLSCSDSDDMDPVAMNEMMNANTIIFDGSFVSDGHPTSGTVEVIMETNELLFKNFKTDKGPNLDVVLATSLDYTDYITISDLQGIEGNYSYDLPTNTNLTKYKYVVIWCVDFSVSFGHAELKMP